MKFTFITKYVEYYMHLDNVRVVNLLRYRYKGKAIIYGFRCLVDGMVYVGSTTMPKLRFHNHLITGSHSNAALQAAINEHGLENFVAYVFELVVLPPNASKEQVSSIMRSAEQRHINKFPKAQLYNSINSSVQSS